VALSSMAEVLCPASLPIIVLVVTWQSLSAGKRQFTQRSTSPCSAASSIALLRYWYLHSCLIRRSLFVSVHIILHFLIEEISTGTFTVSLRHVDFYHVKFR
jgi:hypothetical protein